MCFLTHITKANFGAVHWNILSSRNILFLKSEQNVHAKVMKQGHHDPDRKGVVYYTKDQP